jgi:hypothetical protein
MLFLKTYAFALQITTGIVVNQQQYVQHAGRKDSNNQLILILMFAFVKKVKRN